MKPDQSEREYRLELARAVRQGRAFPPAGTLFDGVPLLPETPEVVPDLFSTEGETDA